MSRVPKWKIEKAKVKVVFRLQFHATNIPSTGWDKLFLSFISADTGKVTAKTNKANVRNGSCKWPDPIYEATRLLQDSRTKTYDDKLYKLVVAMGTSRSSILGEVDVNLAEFAEAVKPVSITLPFRGCNFGTVLHVTAQLLSTKTGFREFEQQRETGARSSQQLVNQRSHDPSEVAVASSNVGSDKANARNKLKETSLGFPVAEDSAGSTEDYENSSHNSDGYFAEKNDPCGSHEISSFRSIHSGDLPLCPTSQSPTPEKGPFRGKRLSPQGSSDWSHGWSPEFSASHDLAAAHDENNRLKSRLEVAESAFSQLKSEATSLQDVTDKLGSETQGLANQLAVELMSRSELTTEVSSLRTECSSLKRELEEMKSAKPLQHKADGGNGVLATDSSVHNLQTEWLQGLLLLESKLQRVIENLKQGVQLGQMKENNYQEHLAPPSNVAHQSSSGRDHNSDKKNTGSTATMEEKMCGLLQKLEDSKTEKENLLEKMSQIERYYESFIHKLEESQKQTAIELENLRKEHNSCFYTVSVLQAQKQKMHEEMNDQLMRFAEDRTALEAQNKEFERRAVATETALKRVRWNYSAAVDRLQKDLELLSFQVLSMYESSETLAKQPIVEDAEHFPEEHSAIADLSGTIEHDQDRPVVKQRGTEGLHEATASQMFSTENGTSLSFSYKMDDQQNLLRAAKIEELRSRSEVICNPDSQVNCSNTEGPKDASSTMESDILETYAVNIQWQVFSDVLRESHYTALDMIKQMQGRLYVLEKELHDSNDARESLMLKLNSALDQSKSLKESESGYIFKCDDLTVKNQILEAKLQDISVENALLMERLVVSETLVEEHKTCESKYNACTEERKRFENLLMKESQQTSQLKDELRSVMEDFEAVKDELRKQSSLISEQQIVSTSLQEQLSILCSKLISLSKDIDIPCLDDVSLLHELENKNYAAVIASLEFFQQQACQKVLHLHHEKDALEEMCDFLRKRSDKSETELLDVKQKFHCDMAGTEEKLNISEGHELERTKITLAESDEDNKTLAESLQSKDELLMHMENEIRGLQNCLSCTEGNLLREKTTREDLESALASLTSQLSEKDQVLLSYNEDKTELLHLRDQISDMSKENSLMQDALSESEQIKRDLSCKNCSLQSQLANAENQLGTILEDFLATEIEASCMRSQVEEVAVQLEYLKNDFGKLQLKNKDADELLRAHMLTVAELTDRNATLESAIHSQEINFARVIQEKEGLEELIKRNEQTLAQVSNSESRDTSVSINNSEAELKYQDEIVQLRAVQTNLEEHVDGLRSAKDEVEILNVVLKSKLEEHHTEASSLLQDSGYQLTNLKEQNKELTQKLAEQTLKAEEFKNLSIQLRELKEKAEAGKKEKEGSLFAIQDSLRIAFIKEQYESKVQELKSQVFVSKKYSEEMLLKLQSALDEVETGRKNEIALAKRIEELSMKVSELEVEMQDLSADKRELSNAYDSIMTDLECTKLNFDCCKEEKQRIEVSLQECSEERNRIRVELDLVKKLLENMALTDHVASPDNSGSRIPRATSIGQILGDVKSGSAPELIPKLTEVDSELQEDEGEIHSTHISSNVAESEDVGKSDEHPHAKHAPTKNLENCHKQSEESLEDHPTVDNTIKDISKEHKKLANDLNLFQKELERLKNENSSPLLPLDINLIDPSLSGLERALSQLDMANEHLRSIFPSFKELPGSGNALERVLALELELAEALQTKKKTDILFQSSFLKQHNDESAVFQSFRDINELIQDTIELRRKQVAVESELEEMHGPPSTN
ncbi:unnamed protein product [Triticum turgidum subsp. durum]|uniref:C2 NT-type domain-containing protein n=1 Tax=Triticum turgidum subsp. durum TaxID=4567 RepID=A0A9R0Y913_TRITD|nr:unnamed protein product [Triticum turgidum subsp. durum]